MENQVILADLSGRSEGVTETILFGAVTYVPQTYTQQWLCAVMECKFNNSEMYKNLSQVYVGFFVCFSFIHIAFTCIQFTNLWKEIYAKGAVGNNKNGVAYWTQLNHLFCDSFRNYLQDFQVCLVKLSFPNKPKAV